MNELLVHCENYVGIYDTMKKSWSTPLAAYPDCCKVAWSPTGAEIALGFRDGHVAVQQATVCQP